MSYADFLARKVARVETPGREIGPSDVHPMLHAWQNELVRWAVQASRAALWADTGMGKTVMQVEWARLSAPTSLIVAPLAVCQQTVREAAKLGVEAHYLRPRLAALQGRPCGPGQRLPGLYRWPVLRRAWPHPPTDHRPRAPAGAFLRSQTDPLPIVVVSRQ